MTLSHTAVATVAAVEMTGAAALLVDIEPIHYSIAPDELRRGLEDPSPGLPPSGRW